MRMVRAPQPTIVTILSPQPEDHLTNMSNRAPLGHQTRERPRKRCSYRQFEDRIGLCHETYYYYNEIYKNYLFSYIFTKIQTKDV